MAARSRAQSLFLATSAPGPSSGIGQDLIRQSQRHLHTTVPSAFSASVRRKNDANRDDRRDRRDDGKNISRTAKTRGKQPLNNIFGEESKAEKGGSHRTQYNYDLFSEQPNIEHYDFPLVDSEWLAKRAERPRRVRMLTRDFIHDSLYNPHYGYFSRHAVLLPDDAQRGQQHELSQYKNEYEFTQAVDARYRAFEDAIKAHEAAGNADKAPSPASASSNKSPAPSSKSMPGTRSSPKTKEMLGRLDQARRKQSQKEAIEHDQNVQAMAARQVWHTPTELFKPHYAQAIAKYCLENASRNEPLTIYEVGAGSGALASDILNYLEKEHPAVYANMRYEIVEISSRLAEQQQGLLARHISAGRANVTNTSIYAWDKDISGPCFFIALEVFDNLTHDVVRYTTDNLQPYQAVVSIDERGDMHELWEPLQDARIKRYYELVGSGDHAATAPPAAVSGYHGKLPRFVRRALSRHFPLYPNLTTPQYVPTGSVALLDVLAKHFPQHRLVMSDFDKLPDAVEGYNAPVVQTRLEGTMVPVTQYLVHQGFFDIFFPTDFKELKKMHDAVVQNYGAASQREADKREGQILPHGAFLKKYGNIPATTCRDGSNPMLTWYANASWYLS